MKTKNSNAHNSILGNALTKRLHACAQGTGLTPDELIALGVRRLCKEFENKGEIVLRAQNTPRLIKASQSGEATIEPAKAPPQEPESQREAKA